MDTFEKFAKECGVEIDEVIQDEYHRPADLKSEGYAFIRKCVEHQFPYAVCAPFILPAGTDAVVRAVEFYKYVLKEIQD